MTQPIMTIEELFAFGKHQRPQSFYNNHRNKDFAKIIRHHFKLVPTITEYCNFEIPDITPKSLPYYTTVYPHHKALIQPEHTEGILCDQCEDTVLIFRHTPRISNGVLSNRYSTYHPQESKSCRCKAMTVLVSHKGTPHIYTDHSFQLVTYFNNHELRHRDFTYSELPKELNLYLEETNGDRQEPTCSISFIGPRSNVEMLMMLPQSQTYGFLNHKPMNISEHLRRYAYTFSLLIIDKEQLYLPNGCIIQMTNNKLKAWLRQPLPANIKPAKFSRIPQYKSMFNAWHTHNDFAEKLNEFACSTFNLPLVKLKYYPKNTITYMQYLKPPEVFTPYFIHRLKRLRRQVSKLARRALLTNDQIDLVQYTKDYFPAPIKLKTPPAEAYYKSQAIFQETSFYRQGISKNSWHLP